MSLQYIKSSVFYFLVIQSINLLAIVCLLLLFRGVKNIFAQTFHIHSATCALYKVSPLQIFREFHTRISKPGSRPAYSPSTLHIQPVYPF